MDVETTLCTRTGLPSSLLVFFSIIYVFFIHFISEMLIVPQGIIKEPTRIEVGQCKKQDYQIEKGGKTDSKFICVKPYNEFAGGNKVSLLFLLSPEKLIHLEPYPVSTRRRFDVDTTLSDVKNVIVTTLEVG